MREGEAPAEPLSLLGRSMRPARHAFALPTPCIYSITAFHGRSAADELLMIHNRGIKHAVTHDFTGLPGGIQLAKETTAVAFMTGRPADLFDLDQ